MRMRSLLSIAAGCALVGTLFSSSAWGDQTYCGAVSAAWNVPNGGAVFSSGPGPIKDVLKAVGEYRSHSMLSNGPGGYVTHAGSRTPPQNNASYSSWPYSTPFCSSCGSACWNPLDVGFLHNSTPGMEQVQNGAIYTYIYADHYSSGTNNVEHWSDDNWTFVSYQKAQTICSSGQWVDQANKIGNWSWSGGYVPGRSDYIGFNVPGYGGSYTGYGVTFNGTQMHYGWNQYMDVRQVPNGLPGLDTGVVCSSALALWQHNALAGSPSSYTGDVAPRLYGPSQISAGANALWNAVYNECQSANGWFASVGSFFTNVGWTAICPGVTGYWQGICGQAADQMVNCFAANNCGATSSPGDYFGAYGTKNNGNAQWQSVVSYQTAHAISPDDVACWHGNGTGAPCSGANSSVWGWDVNNQLTWNSGGNLYSCWD